MKSMLDCLTALLYRTLQRASNREKYREERLASRNGQFPAVSSEFSQVVLFLKRRNNWSNHIYPKERLRMLRLLLE
jgi:hypothetical protein